MAKADWDARIGRRITLRDLHILSFAVRWGSMAKAAAHLSTTQSVVSGAVANLEAALGVRLLDRSATGVTPTPYAKALLDRGNIVFDELREAVREIEALAHSKAGDVRIACPEFVAAGLVTDALSTFSRDFPAITCEVTDADVNTLEFRQLQDRSVDLMVARVPSGYGDDDLKVEVLFDDPHVVVVGAASRWAHATDVTLADLVHEPWIIPASLIVRQIIEESFETAGLRPPDGQVVSSFLLMRRQLLETGRFLTVLPTSVLGFDAGNPSFCALPIQLSSRPRPIAMLMLKNRTISPAVQLFIDCLRSKAADYRSRR